jgi:hypothetical protein
MEFESGARAIVQMTHAAGLGDGHLGFYGSEGELVIPNLFATEIRGGRRPDKSAPLEIPERYRLSPEQPPLRAPFRVLFNRMVHAIDNGLPSPSPNFEDGVNSQIVSMRRIVGEKRWGSVRRSACALSMGKRSPGFRIYLERELHAGSR